MADKGKFSQQSQPSKQLNENGDTNNNNTTIHQALQQQQQPQQVSSNITRERSFIRTSNQQNINKRRSLAFNVSTNTNYASNIQMRAKPIVDVYRQPNVNYNLEHSSSSSVLYTTNSNAIQYVTATNSMFNQQQQQQARLSLGSAPLMNLHIKQQQQFHHRPILLTHSHSVQMNHLGHAGSMAHHIPLVNSPSSGNILHHANRVKFAPEPKKSYKSHGQPSPMGNILNQNLQMQQRGQTKSSNAQQLRNNKANDNIISLSSSSYPINSLQRSKSLSSADALTRGIAGLGLGLGNDVTDIGPFPAEVKSLIDAALEDPNKLNSRNLMELSSHFIKRTVEGRRYALPISRICLNIIAKEQKETFLEAILNTCRQWYQEREKLLFAIQGMKSPSRACLTSFMAFLTEMFCQLKRRQLQLQSPQCETVSPPIILLTLLSKCCEDCVKPPIKSLSEIECLFYVLTCIGQDMEVQLPQQLEILLSMIRDAFLNANDSPPTIRRTLLQLIELQASHWQLPGNTVLYYYPSVK